MSPSVPRLHARVQCYARSRGHVTAPRLQASRSGAGEVRVWQAPLGLEVRAMTRSGAGERLGAFVANSQSTAAFPEVSAQPLRYSVRAVEASFPPFQRTAAFREAFLPSLQRLALSLALSPSFLRMLRGSGRRASEGSNARRSFWRRAPVPSASRETAGGDHRCFQHTATPLEARLPFRHHRPQGRKNRLQPLRRHLQELEACLKVVRTVLCAALSKHPSPEPLRQNGLPPWSESSGRCLAPPQALPHRGFASQLRRCGPLFHETTPLGLR